MIHHRTAKKGTLFFKLSRIWKKSCLRRLLMMRWLCDSAKYDRLSTRRYNKRRRNRTRNKTRNANMLVTGIAAKSPSHREAVPAARQALCATKVALGHDLLASILSSRHELETSQLAKIRWGRIGVAVMMEWHYCSCKQVGGVRSNQCRSI